VFFDKKYKKYKKYQKSAKRAIFLVCRQLLPANTVVGGRTPPTVAGGGTPKKYY